MKNTLFSTFACLLFLFALAPDAGAQEKAKDPAAASVDGKAIQHSEVEFELTHFKRRMAQSGQPVDESREADLRKTVLDNLIARELLFQEAERKGIQADTQSVDAQMEKIKSRFSDEAGYKSALEEMGTTDERMRQRVARGVVIQTYVDDRVSAAIAVTEKESREFYDAHPEFFQQPESVKASHILIRVAQDADEKTQKAARDKIEDIRKKLGQGEDFSELAKKHSEDPGAAEGGDLGFFARGKMVKPFEDAAFALEVGAVSDVVVTPFGYHLIRVTDKKPAGTVSFADVGKDIEGFLKRKKTEEAVSQTVETLKKERKVEVF